MEGIGAGWLLARQAGMLEWLMSMIRELMIHLPAEVLPVSTPYSTGLSFTCPGVLAC